MANLLTNFPSIAAMQAASDALDSGVEFDAAYAYAALAFDNLYEYDISYLTADTNSYIAGVLTNGDSFAVYGSGLLGYPYIITQIDYTLVSAGVTTQIFGSVSQTSEYADVTGYLSKFIVTFGSSTVTVDGYFDINSPTGTITSIKVEYGLMSLTQTGTIYTDGYSVWGTINSFTLLSGSLSAGLTGVSLDAYTALETFETVDEFLGYALSGNDSVSGTSAGEYLPGYAGNDTLYGGAEDDHVDGGTGIDTAVFTGNWNAYNLTPNGSGFSIADTVGTDGTDTLTNIERLQFTDKHIALDLAPTDNAGRAVLFIGVLAPSAVALPTIVGQILNLVDGGMNMQQLNQFAFDIGLTHSLAGGSSNADVARLAFENVVGAPATPDWIDLLVSFMDGRSASFTQAEFLTVVANLEVNQTNVDLVGLAQTGIEYAVG